MTQRDEREKTDITGWKLVPDDPTEEMWQAGRSADEHPGDSYSKVWRAMFNAAPNVDDCETTSATAPDSEAMREAHAEIQRLQDAKRRALAIADERAKENVALREALNAIIDASQSFRNSMPKDWEGDPLQDAINAASALTHAPVPASEGAQENLGSPEWDRAVKAAAPEPADTPDEGPDPLGYAKGEQ